MNGLSIYFILCVLVFPISESMSQEAGKTGILKISRPAFENNKPVPKKYTCDGVNVNPPVKIENVPREAKSLASILDDKDAPRGTYVHWILWGIHLGLAEIRENSVPEGAAQGRNDFKKNN
jgi:Raf kinase inhibitor-like YbhB/YbcL family protein